MFTDLRSHGSGLPFAVRPDLFIISCGQHRTPCVLNGLRRTIVSRCSHPWSAGPEPHVFARVWCLPHLNAAQAWLMHPD